MTCRPSSSATLRARSVPEVILAYPGLHAIWLHRLAHRLYLLNVPVLPRLVSHFTRWVTGIEIHPAARIGRASSSTTGWAW